MLNTCSFYIKLIEKFLREETSINEYIENYINFYLNDNTKIPNQNS